MFIIGLGGNLTSTAAPHNMLASNQVLNQGRYRIIHQFGQVESGRLYEAYDTVNDTKVVLRESSGQIGNATPGQLETLKFTFADQAKRWAEIQHESLLSVRDYFSDTDRQYLVMESVDGSDLKELLQDGNNKPALSDALRWADQLLSAVHHLHCQTPQIIHQNIRPENIRLTSSFAIKLLMASDTAANDISAIVEDGTDLNFLGLEQLWAGLDSASQNVIANGYAGYDDSLLGRPADVRTDVYAAGATIYYLLTGTPPADALARTIDILDGKDDPLAKPSDLDPAIPAAVSDILVKSLQIKRQDRFASVLSMRESLAAAAPAPATVFSKASAKPAVEAKSGDVDQLEKQRQLIEQKRIELENEQRKLEEDRKRIEREAQELKAKEEARLQLLERQKREAEEAKRLAAEKQKREAEAKAAAMAKKQSHDENVEKEIDDILDNLLDLPRPDMRASAVHPPQADVLSLDESIDGPSEAAIHTTGDFEKMFESPVKRSGLFARPALIFAAAAAVICIGVGAWLFSGSGSATPAPAVVQQPAVSTSDPQPESASVPAAPAAETSTQPAVSSFSDPEAVSALATGAKPDASKAKAKKPTPETKPTTAPQKKAVTVDDLINDN